MNSSKMVWLYPTPKILIAVSLFLSTGLMQLNAQILIKGKILYAKDARPAAFASVKLINHPGGSVSDELGNFRLVLKSIKQTDTLLISSVGYENLKIPAQNAILKSEFILMQSAQILESVTVKSFSQEETVGDKSEIVGYYRSWNTGNKGGEIGRTFLMTHKEYQVAKIRFKIYNTCDTCIVRLHIREVIDGHPGKELVRDSISKVIRKSTDDDKPYEIDLNKYNIILKNQKLFVGFEVVGNSKADHNSCSLSFVGSEPGSYFYKPTREDYWGYIEDYAIFMKLFLKYDD
ncbi:carboxypeptidase-like regulatory domain-containing protein [Ferruginibacter sp.]